MLPDLVVAPSAALGRAITPSHRTKGQIAGVTDSGHHNGGWDQGQPILDCKWNWDKTIAGVFSDIELDILVNQP